jgi:hypothetical protein
MCGNPTVQSKLLPPRKYINYQTLVPSSYGGLKVAMIVCGIPDSELAPRNAGCVQCQGWGYGRKGPG